MYMLNKTILVFRVIFLKILIVNYYVYNNDVYVHKAFFAFFFHSSFLLEERCRFLSVFSIATADVELPGQFLFPKPNMVSTLSLVVCSYARPIAVS